MLEYKWNAWTIIAGVALLVGTTGLVGLPSLGANAGGIIAIMTAAIVMFIQAKHIRLNARNIIIGVAVVVLTTILFVLYDSYAGSSTHIGSVVKMLTSGRSDEFILLVPRKLDTNLTILRYSTWTYFLIAVFGLMAFLFFKPVGLLRKTLHRHKGIAAAIYAAFIGGTAGFFFEDSGILIPAIAMSYMIPTLVYLMLWEQYQVRDQVVVMGIFLPYYLWVVAHAFTGAIVALLLLPLFKNMLYDRGVVVQNYRQKEVVSMAGLVIIVSWVIMMAIAVLASFVANTTGFSVPPGFLLGPEIAFPTSIIVLGAGLFGVLDDRLGGRQHSGFRGHFGALISGQLTTGALKALGIPLLALLAVSMTSVTILDWLGDALLVALFVNTLNLLDLRPGRALRNIHTLTGGHAGIIDIGTWYKFGRDAWNISGDDRT